MHGIYQMKKPCFSFKLCLIFGSLFDTFYMMLYLKYVFKACKR